MKLRYFAWVRVKIGCSEEEIVAGPSTRTVADLLGWLAARGAGYAEALAKPEVIRVAVNFNYVDRNYVLSDRDEVALFPPVTGG